MSTNPLINGVKDGLIHPGQLEQSLLGRGHLKRHIAGTRVGHVIKRPLVLPIDSEGRLLDTTADSLLKDSEYMRRRQQLFPVFTMGTSLAAMGFGTLYQFIHKNRANNKEQAE